VNREKMRGNVSKLIFIDSSINSHNDHTRILLPPHPFSAQGQDKMTISLVSFGMRRGWHNINPTNSIFYIFVSNTYHEVEIASGTYTTFNALAIAINDAITGILGNINEINQSATAYNATTRKFSITFTMNAAHLNTAVEIRCFLVKSGVLPANVTRQGSYSDSFMILGAKPIRFLSDLFNSFDSVGNVHTSKHTAALNSLDAIYIHAHSIETGNYMSTAFESFAQDSLRAIESSLFARIPIDEANFTEIHEVIQFEDSGGDMFSSLLTRKNVDSIDIRITDSRGRSLAQYDFAASANSAMIYRMVLRWDLFSHPEPHPVDHSIKSNPLPSV
jgi:hypothetical protein